MFLSSCEKKYPDGPFISFLSIENRVLGTYKVTEISDNGIIADTSQLSDYLITFYRKKSEDSKYGNYESPTIKADFTWELSSDKKFIELDFNNGNYSSKEIFRILELRDKTMKLEWIIDGTIRVYSLEEN